MVVVSLALWTAHSQSHMMPSVILLDYGGVVADHYSEPALSELAFALNSSAKNTLAALSESTSHGKAFRLDACNIKEFWGAVFRQLAIHPPQHSIDRLQYLWAETYVPNTAMLKLMQFYRQHYGVYTALALNEDRYRLNHICSKNHITSYCDHIFASCELGLLKPDPIFFHKCIQELSLKGSCDMMLYVDDRQTHADAAASVGISTYVYRNPGDLSLYLKQLFETI